VTSAETIAKVLGGRKTVGGWVARCPAHDDRTPSLSVRESSEGKILVHCFAGCPQSGVIEALRARGLWRGLADRAGNSPPGRRPEHRATDHEQEQAKHTEFAGRLWRSAAAAEGTLVETYLHRRGIDLPVPTALRFCANLKHPAGSSWPGLVASVTGGATNGEVVAVHRTFLARDGSAKAPVDPQKMMLGPCCGGAAQLAKASAEIAVTQGIETGLSVLGATGVPTWARPCPPAAFEG
jgi:putative DNA primase/helicase